MTNNVLQVQAIKSFREVLASLGINPLEVTEIAGRDRAATAGTQSPPTIHAILEAAVTMSGDPTLAIKIGNGLDLAAYGVYGFALMSCADMGSALELFLRYGQTFIPSSSWHRTVHRDGITIRLQQDAGTPYQQMLVTELAFSQIHLQSKLLVARPVEGNTLYFNYPKPLHIEAYEKTWPLPMAFDQAHNQIFISHQCLRQRVRTGDSRTNILFRQQCEEIVHGMPEVDEIAASVRRILIHSAGNFLSMGGVAKQLHITERTLRRRLAAEGTDFRTLFDDIKNTLAQNYLRKTSLSVVEIADLLDYAEATNFHRAFQRWNATTPADYRQRAT